MENKSLTTGHKRVNSGKICEKVISNASDIAHHYMEKLKDKKKVR